MPETASARKSRRPALAVVAAVARTHGFSTHVVEHPWGCEYYLREGRMMPTDGLAQLRGCDAIYLGAIGAPSVPDHVSVWELILPIRQHFEQYVNLRPMRLLAGVPGPLRDRTPADIDWVCVRENSEGEYAGPRRPAAQGHAARSGASRPGSSRIAASSASCATRANWP